MFTPSEVDNGVLYCCSISNKIESALFPGTYLGKKTFSYLISILKRKLVPSPSCFVNMLALLDRFILVSNENSLPLHLEDICFVHGLVEISLLLAVKVNEDYAQSNKAYVVSAGLTLQEMNRMEREFIERLGWNVHVCISDYEFFEEEIWSYHALSKENFTCMCGKD